MSSRLFEEEEDMSQSVRIGELMKIDLPESRTQHFATPKHSNPISLRSYEEIERDRESEREI